MACYPLPWSDQWTRSKSATKWSAPGNTRGARFRVSFLIKLKIFSKYFFKVENESHCDFNHLREMLLRVNLEDLRSTTHTRHYELYRRNKLVEMGFNDDAQNTNGNFNLQEVYEHKREEHLRLMQDKEDEMRQVINFLKIFFKINLIISRPLSPA